MTTPYFTAKEFHVEAMIPGPPGRAWAVLNDTVADSVSNLVLVRDGGANAEGANVFIRADGTPGILTSSIDRLCS